MRREVHLPARDPSAAVVSTQKSCSSCRQARRPCRGGQAALLARGGTAVPMGSWRHTRSAPCSKPPGSPRARYRLNSRSEHSHSGQMRGAAPARAPASPRARRAVTLALGELQLAPATRPTDLINVPRRCRAVGSVTLPSSRQLPADRARRTAKQPTDCPLAAAPIMFREDHATFLAAEVLASSVHHNILRPSGHGCCTET